MAMRRGHHTSRVLKALGTKGTPEEVEVTPRPPSSEILPNEFLDVHEEEDEQR
jgi:acetolactate synthase-1/3 small subunit